MEIVPEFFLNSGLKDCCPFWQVLLFIAFFRDTDLYIFLEIMLRKPKVQQISYK